MSLSQHAKLTLLVNVEHMTRQGVSDSKRLNPSLELLENDLFSNFLNHNTLGSGNVVNSYIKSYISVKQIQGKNTFIWS